MWADQIDEAGGIVGRRILGVGNSSYSSRAPWKVKTNVGRDHLLGFNDRDVCLSSSSDGMARNLLFFFVKKQK